MVTTQSNNFLISSFGIFCFCASQIAVALEDPGPINTERPSFSSSPLALAGCIAKRAMVLQSKTQQPVQFEITEQTRVAIKSLICNSKLHSQDYLFKSRFRSSKHLSTRQYARIVKSWISSIGLDPGIYGTHTMRRTKASLIYRRTKNLRAVQLLLGHTKLESTVRYLGIEVDDALEMAEKTEV